MKTSSPSHHDGASSPPIWSGDHKEEEEADCDPERNTTTGLQQSIQLAASDALRQTGKHPCRVGAGKQPRGCLGGKLIGQQSLERMFAAKFYFFQGYVKKRKKKNL